MTLTEKLQIMQNKIIRFILNLTRRDSIRDKELPKAEFLSVTDRVKKLKINHVFNIKNHNCPHICTNRQMKTKILFINHNLYDLYQYFDTQTKMRHTKDTQD